MQLEGVARHHLQNRLGSIQKIYDLDIPWYRERGYDGFVTREDVLRYPHGFTNPKAKRTIYCYTSGSTGEPLRTLTTREQEVFEQETVYRAWMEAGYRLGDPVAIMRSYVPENTKDLFRYDKRRNWLYMSAFHLGTNWAEYVKALEDFQPRIIRGYPSSLGALSRFPVKADIDPVSVICSSEVMLDSDKASIEKFFECPVFNWYGQAERTAVAYTRKCGGMHFDDRYGKVEIVDGEIVATNLWNTAMPLIRYRTGDMVVMGKCSCGLPAIERIDGRRCDMLEGKHGKVSSVNIYSLFSHENVIAWQVIQDKKGIEVRYTGHLNEKNVAGGLINRLGLPVRFSKKHFLVNRDGKRRPIVRL